MYYISDFLISRLRLQHEGRVALIMYVFSLIFRHLVAQQSKW